DVAAGLRVHTFGREEVLDAEGDAFQRARLAFGDAGVGGLRHLARLFRRDGDIGVERTVRGLDRAEIGVRQFDGGDLLGAELFAGFSNGEAGEFGHGRTTFGSGRLWRRRALFDDLGHLEEVAVGRRGIGDDIVRLAAVVDDVFALAH